MFNTLGTRGYLVIEISFHIAPPQRGHTEQSIDTLINCPQFGHSKLWNSLIFIHLVIISHQ